MTGILSILITALSCALVIRSTRMVLLAKKREHAHEVLLYRVKRLRLHKMLAFLGINQDEYLRAVPPADINQQIHRCSHCKELDICDSCLRDGKSIVNMNFCPNHKSLTEHSNTIRLHRLG